jgi:microcin C transport system permease protein
MINYVIRRLCLMLPTLVGITFLVFMMIALSPGGIGAALKAQGGAMQSQSGVAVQQAYLEDRYGLSDPVVVQYVRWLGRISPVRVGQRDQIAPNGETVRAPKPLKQPTLWAWFAPALPVEPAPTSVAAAGPEAKVARYRAADRAYAEARAAFVAEDALLREALKEYAREIGRPDAVGRDLKVRPERLARSTPRKDAASWAKVEKHGVASIKAYASAQTARAELVGAFADRPYEQAGIGTDMVSLAWPDLGVSFSRGRPVIELIGRALPVTLMLNVIATPIIYAAAITMGILAASRRGSFIDVSLGAVSIALWSVPIVLAGILMIGFLASKDYLHLFPVGKLHDTDAELMTYLPSRDNGVFQRGYLLDTLWHLALPVACLVYGGFAVISKQTRAAMLDNFNADFVRTAKAKGVSGSDILFRHVFRNSLLPLITMFVSIFPAMLAGSVVIERIFSIPGMGSLVIDAINLRDRELILANTTMIAVVNMLALLLADILYALADPRVSYE